MEECNQWFPSFDIMTGYLLPAGNPMRMKGLKRTRALMEELIDHLIHHSGFNSSNIFFFGFSQGGTVALDTLLFSRHKGLGGVVSISGYLLEEQEEHTEKEKYGGYILITQGEKDQTIGDKSTAEKRFKAVEKFCKPSAKVSQVFITNKDHIMPKSESEWRVIHTFFGKYMPRRNLQLENMSDVYLVDNS
ncbi:hypothetical protein BDF20DRAFT_868208 [Mycotypha africana]|uniref:uncharacterized protein n=1 Tax=Mycotypha africana TaxID=64632 RepID=UPI002300B335|nr:uncharacterized protein BDF20DRAFT_868208 [Mycotypha africana]KAI8979204.1 hypothetical protein BDF20DRAFT_868208 [Mycotypha africana]